MSFRTPPSQTNSQEPVFGRPERPNSYHGAYSPARRGLKARSQFIKGARPGRNWRNGPPATPRPSPKPLNPTGPVLSMHDLSSIFGSNSSSLSSNHSGSGESTDGSNPKPQMMSPRTKEKTFTEIMNHAFDLTNSPSGLGRRLSSSGKPNDGWLLQSPMTPPSSCGESSFTRTSPMRSGKRVASSDASPSFKQIKTSIDSSPSSANRSNNDSCIDRWDIPTDYRDNSGNMVLDEPEVGKLLDMMRSNIQQSKELTDLFAKFVQQTITDPNQQDFQSDRTGSQTGKPVKHTETPGSSSHGSAVGSGGDGPDPPRDPNNPFRGHMIDRQDIEVTDTESESDQKPDLGMLDNLQSLSSPPTRGQPIPLGNGCISTVKQDGNQVVAFQTPYLPDDVQLSLNTDDFSHGIVFPNSSPTGENRWFHETLDLAGESEGGDGNIDIAEDGRERPSFSRQDSTVSESDRDTRSKAPSPDSQSFDPQPSHSRKKSVRFDLPSPETSCGMLSDEKSELLGQSSGDETEGDNIPYQAAAARIQFDLPLRVKPIAQGFKENIASDNQIPSQKPRDLEYSIRRQLCSALESSATTPPPIRPPSPAFRSTPSNVSPIGPRAPPSSPLRL